MSELVEWLRAQVAADEAVAAVWRRIAESVGRVFGDDDPPGGDMSPADRAYFALHDAADRLLAGCAAKRAMLDRFEKISGTSLALRRAGRKDMAVAGALLEALGMVTLLAQPYASRPGWREEWRVG